MRLLFVEDNPDLMELVPKGLSREGFTVDHVAGVEDAYAALETTRYDALILDLGLPDGEGLDVLRRLRGGGGEAPVLILTARDGLEDRLTGLNSGADDYLIKPFALEELVARIRALLRRPGGVLGVTLNLAAVTLDTVARDASVNGVSLKLPRRELDILETLMRRAGQVVPKAVIEDRLYGFDDELSSNAVEVNMSRLRKNLEKAGTGITIHTVRGVGYLATGGEGA
ncbi:response regulator [Aestuariispira insulae]|uniref:Winged helix family two component transcriptional regulator n=1 Tax=Aestuariispira insulae TaxID=1461337 RepID=A0A3D9HWZ7_9PROT|nr:response regulator transcription factor [Aestuariispira insulae]RED53939.1 winged helix family two component transcriptional regulator [Aestuariispira insulae]